MQAATQELIVTTVTAHAESLLRVARRYSLCEADAEDAYQRALEALVKHAHRLDPATAHRWLHTVLKHEALAVREQRARYVEVGGDDDVEALGYVGGVVTPDERTERFEELTRAAEALGRCKPHEMTALVLKAQGLSYKEIGERQGWSATKVNRCISEGRRAFLRGYEGLESGAECERRLPVLAAIVDGEATAEQLVEVRPHLRRCASCRSVLAGMRRSQAPVAALLPAPVLAAPVVEEQAAGWLARLSELAVGAHDRVALPLVKAQALVEGASAAKLAAVAASTAALAGGGVAVREHVEVRGEERAAAPARVAVTTPAVPSPPPVASARPEPAPVVRRPERPAPRRPRPVSPPGAEFAAEEPAAATGPAEEFAPASDPPAKAVAARNAPRAGTDEFGGEAPSARDDGGEFGLVAE